MDIVKQRRKRLMAWILAIGLCVGLWQGNAYAGEVPEEDSSVSGNNAAEEGVMLAEEEVMLAEEGVLLAEDARTGSFNISYNDNDRDNKLAKTYSNGSSITISDTSSSITLTGKSGEYEHALISWSVSASGGSSKIDGEGNTISFSGFTPDSSDNTMYVVWEKILVVKNGDKSEAYYESKNSNPAPIPSITDLTDAEVCSQGSFLSGWDIKQGETTIEQNATSYIFVFDNTAELYTEISLEKKYGNNKVPRGGTFTLQSGTYVLGDSSEQWNVNSDGYEYSGGVNFYIPEEKAYTFVKK